METREYDGAEYMEEYSDQSSNINDRMNERCGAPS